MWCYDQTSCDYRYKNAQYSMSSLTWKDSFSQGGIFEDNPVKSPIAGANKAFVTYCSSDAWVGDGISYGFAFRGQRIVAAVLASLVQKQGMGSVPDTRLIFGGCSAGGRGAAFNVDYVSDILTRAGAPDVAVYGLLDAALWIDIPPAVPGIVSQQCQTAALAVMANATARLDTDCVAAYPGSESWKCLYGCAWQRLRCGSFIDSIVGSTGCPSSRPPTSCKLARKTLFKSRSTSMLGAPCCRPPHPPISPSPRASKQPRTQWWRRCPQRARRAAQCSAPHAFTTVVRRTAPWPA